MKYFSIYQQLHCSGIAGEGKEEHLSSVTASKWCYAPREIESREIRLERKDMMEGVLPSGENCWREAGETTIIHKNNHCILTNGLYKQRQGFFYHSLYLFPL